MRTSEDGTVLLRLALLIVALLVSLGLNLCLGDVPLGPAEAWQALTSPHSENLRQSGIPIIIWQIRLPRLLVAAVVGAGLAGAGYILQALARNFLADPYLTGVSSGAGLAVALAMLTGVDFAFVPLVALSGALAASLTVAGMARSPQGLSITKLLLAGVALSAICSALITLLMIHSASAIGSQALFFWLAGGISGSSWGELSAAAAYIGIGLALSALLSKPLRVLSMGTQSAASLGLDVAKTQWALLLAAVLMCGAAVSVSGLVGFVGLIAPNVARRLFGTDERLQIAASALTGSVLVLLSDLAARTLGQGQELPLGTLLSLIGGPFFLYLVVQQKGEGL